MSHLGLGQGLAAMDSATQHGDEGFGSSEPSRRSRLRRRCADTWGPGIRGLLHRQIGTSPVRGLLHNPQSCCCRPSTSAYWQPDNALDGHAEWGRPTGAGGQERHSNSTNVTAPSPSCARNAFDQPTENRPKAPATATHSRKNREVGTPPSCPTRRHSTGSYSPAARLGRTSPCNTWK